MNDLIQRIEECSRRHPQLAISLFQKLEQRAYQEKRLSQALNALVRRFFICERLGSGDTLNDALYSGLQSAEHQGLTYQAGRVMLCLGRIRYTQGIYKEAIYFWTRCIDLCKITHDTEVAIEARIGLGQIYDAMGDWETGASFHRQAGTQLETFDRPYLKSKQTINLGVNCMQLGQIEQATELFHQALAQAKRGNIAEYVAEAHWYLGVLAQRKGQTQVAYDEVQLSIQLAQACKYQWLMSPAFNTLGEIFIEQQLTAQAIEIYLQALQYAEQTGSRKQSAQCCQALSALYEANGEPAFALKYARLHHQISTEIAEVNVIDQFSALREYDLSKKPPVELLLDLSSNSQLENKSLSEALNYVGNEAINILEIDTVCLWLKDGQKLRCEMLANSSANEYPEELTKQTSLGFGVGKILEPQEFLKYFQVVQNLHTPIAIHDLRIHPAAAELSALYQPLALCSLLEISVRLHGNQIGVISFGKAGQRKNWSREDLLFGSHIANLIQQILSLDEHRKAQSRLENRVAERTQELQERTELLRTAHQNIFILSEIGREITSQLDREGIIRTLYQHVHKLMPAEFLSVGVYKAEQGLIDFPCNILHGKDLLPYHRDLQDPDLLSVWCIQHKKAIYINDVHEDYLHYIGIDGLDKLFAEESLDDTDIHFAPLSLIYVPLIVKDRLLGLLSMQSSRRNAFERMHVDMLTTLAAYTAVAFDNADTYQQLSSAQQLLMSKEKLAALGALVAGIAHEINTPLGNCLLTATTLKESSNKFIRLYTENQLKRSDFNHFTSVLHEANEMLMRNLLNASDLVSSFKQVSVDQTSQQRRSFNLLKTSQEIVRTMQSRINKQNHQLLIDIPEQIEIDSYPGPYGQVITNFINNALLHGFEGHDAGTMQLSAKQIDRRHIKICFSDNGNGIRPEHLRRVFDPFFTTKLGQGGSGLGLNIVHNIVTDLLRGTIKVDSKLGEGTKITLQLPVCVD
ncbi:ATP-binding protein [Undibacterium baiyunense]|uniref:histidine kinase n=1 Tax=Undibacterium baiyunense TaxID=2828731 RepID=A0A941DF85_9BURK|nr:ATP-binding protein [Undibacterium baiyunense]MBR7745847.1 GAF domain-containing protein [Undibacterium baiyunense]